MSTVPQLAIELGAMVGVDLADPGFWDRGLDIIERRLESTIEAATAAAPAIGAAFKLGKILGDIGVSADNSAVSRVSRNLSEMLADSHRN